MMDEQAAHSTLQSAQPTPIAQLNPDIPDVDNRIVEGEITLTWPFSIVTKAIAFKLVEREPRLRREKGQVRVDFFGAAGKAVAAAQSGGGDQIRLSLQGVEWEKSQASAIRPDTVEWQLKFHSKLILCLRRPDLDKEEIIEVNSNDVEDTFTEEPVLRDITPLREDGLYEATLSKPPATDMPTKRLASSAFSGDEFASPAFLKRARVSYGALWEGGLDIFDEGSRREPRKKRSRFSMHANWRYASQSPSPSPEPEAEPEKESEAGSGDDGGDEQAVRISLEPVLETPSRPPATNAVEMPRTIEISSPMPAEPPPEPRPRPAELPRAPSPITPPRPSYLPNGSLTGDSTNLFEQVPDMRSAGLPQLDTMRAHEMSAARTPEGFVMDFTNSHTLVQPPVPDIDISPRPIDIARGSGFAMTRAAEDEYGQMQDDGFLPHSVAHVGTFESYEFHDSYPEVPHTMSHLPMSMGFEQPHHDHSHWPVAASTYEPAPLVASSNAEQPVEIIDSPSRVAPPRLDVEHEVEAEDKEDPSDSQGAEDDAGASVRYGTASTSTPRRAEPHAKGDYPDGGDQPGDDYDLRNYDRAKDDDDTGNDDVSDKDNSDPDNQIIDTEESEGEESEESEVEDDIDREGRAFLSQPSASYYGQPNQATSESDAEVEDYEEYDEDGLEEDYDEDYDEEDGEDDVAPPAPQGPVFISLLSDSEDEDAEDEQPTPQSQRTPVVAAGTSSDSEEEVNIKAPGAEATEPEQLPDEAMQELGDESEDSEAEMEVQSPVGMLAHTSQDMASSGADAVSLVDATMAQDESAEEEAEEDSRPHVVDAVQTKPDEDTSEPHQRVDDDMMDAPRELISQAQEESITNSLDVHLTHTEAGAGEGNENVDLTENDAEMQDASIKPEATNDGPEQKGPSDQVPSTVGEQVAAADRSQAADVSSKHDAEVRDDSPTAPEPLYQNQTPQAASHPLSPKYGQSAPAEAIQVSTTAEETRPEADSSQKVETTTTQTTEGEHLQPEQSVLHTEEAQEAKKTHTETPKVQTTALPSAAQLPTPGETQQVVETQSQVIESSDEEDYSMAVENQILMESQEQSHIDEDEQVTQRDETQAQPPAKSKAKPKRERDILITVQSLRSWDHRKSMSSNATDGDSSQDPSIALGRAPPQLSPGKTLPKERSTTPVVRVTRSMAEANDPSILLARASHSSTPKTTQPNTPRETTPEVPKRSPKAVRTPKRGQRVREQKTPEPMQTVQSSKENTTTKPRVPSTPEARSKQDVQSSPPFIEHESLRTLKLQLKKELRSNLPECLALSDLTSALGKTTEAVALVTKTPPQPHRPKSGPRDYMLELILTDPSAGPSNVIVAHIFRQHQAALPIVRAGDAVLLRRFQVVSMKGRGSGLRSKDDSSWAVYEQADEEMLAQVRGPPMEIAEEVVSYVKGLRRWWGALDDAASRKMERASHKAAIAGLGEGKQ